MLDIKNHIKEYLKCRDSFPYFCEKYLRLCDPKTGKLIPLVLNKYQQEFVKIIYDKSITDVYNTYVIESDRQLGMTILMSAYFSWKIIFFENVRILLITNINHHSDRILNIVNNFINDLPSWLKPSESTEDYKYSSWNTINSLNEIVVRNTNSLGYKDYKFTEIFIDEAAFLEYGEEFLKNSLFHIESKLYVVSTGEKSSSFIQNLAKSDKTYHLSIKKEENKTDKPKLTNEQKLNLIKQILEQ